MKLYKLKNFNKLKNWGKFLHANEKTVKKLLEAENATREYFYAFKINGEFYAIAGMEGKDFKPAIRHFINKKHKAILEECLEEVLPIKKIYDL